MDYSEIIIFWFQTLAPNDWWRKNEALDAQILTQFLDIHRKVARGDTANWRQNDEGRLAEIIVLDQFSRNMFRGQPEAFAYDEYALQLCKQAVAVGSPSRLEQAKVNFLLMPYMHSESLHDHQEGLPLFQEYGSEGTLEFEIRHAAIIERFGRYPHRNAILGRISSAEETTFLAQPGSGF